MKPSSATECLRIAIRNHHSVMLVAGPGVGKTAISRQAAEMEEAELLVSHPVVEDPTNYKGQPWVIHEADGSYRATFLPYDELWALINAKKRTVFLLDDLGQAPPAVQAAAMQLILARRINGFKVSDEVVFFACTNRRQDMAGVTGILEPVKSRFNYILHIEPDGDDWRRWAIASNKIAFEVISFIGWKPALLYDFKPTKDMTNSPSPRTWEFVSQIIGAGYPKDCEFELIKGAVGEGAAIEFMAFLKIARSLPSPDLVILHPEQAEVPKDPSTIYALCGALSARAGEQNFGNIVKYANRLPNEFSVLLIVDATLKNHDLVKTKAYVEWSLKHSDVLI